MRKSLLLLVAGLLVFAVFATHSESQPPPADVRIFMRAKLDHSKKVLEGLALEDFRTIAKNAQEMALLSQATNWQVFQTEEYLQHSIDFRRAANALTQAAKDENLDGATLAYVDMTMKCVRCHKYVRSVRSARLDSSSDPLALTLNREK